MNSAHITAGQIWRRTETDEEWLVTRTYANGFDLYAVLRNPASGDSLRLKVSRGADSDELPGFTRIGA